MITPIAFGFLAAATLLLLAFGLNILYITARAMRLGPPASQRHISSLEPHVCVQIPIYNERYVAERVLDAVCLIDWPRDRFEVQVLDDSDDGTVEILARRVAHWRRKGVSVTQLRRGERAGFKAGALAYGLEKTDAPFIAIFDADFVPPREFLRRMMPAFDDTSIAFAQARWGHLDEGYSLFTRMQATAIDFHFLVEQPVRSARGYFTNFTGTAGVWRRTAILDAGGWSARTLTEDLDLSYRAQLRGWKSAYIEDLVVPEELPVSIDAYRRQQARWATGSFQCAYKLLGPVLGTRAPAAVKFQAVMHILAYGVVPLMLIQLACYPVILFTLGPGFRMPWFLAVSFAVAVFVGLAPWIGFMAAQTRRGRLWESVIPSLLCQLIGAGMSLNTMLALLQSARPGGDFVRTPKHHIVEAGQEWRDQDYVRVGDPRVLIESVAALVALSLVPIALDVHQFLIAIYASIFALGFALVAALSLVDFVEVLALRRLGRRALSRMRAAGPAVGLIGLVTVLLLVAAQLSEPFEDGYGHWLIAANLASTGQLHDPLFGMEDTWLPGYHVLAAGVLRLFGLWQLGLLKALSALFGVVTAASVYTLAPNVRQARIAVVLLVLNPVFLFTSGSAVVEPLMTALLMAGALAAVKGRMKLAALLAAMACMTSTKAWIWVVAAAGFAVIESIRSRAGTRRRALGWAVPALGALTVLQLGFAPASHSLARGGVEVMSATARGSIPDGAVGRLSELVTTFGLAALPLFVLGAVGAGVFLRRREAPETRFVFAPALVYLAAILGLVGAGAYSGSHRYLYPVLPVLALLAAAALDRNAHGAARVLAVGATALLAVAFLPVFTSFADRNAGLVAAGRAAAGTPDVLLTDSPVVAYYSGKRPSRLTGSQDLPLDRAQAIEWMRSHAVGALVVEDISYYRSTAVFPDLAIGSASPPFASLGRQSTYQVGGGKTVYAYRFGTPLRLKAIYPGLDAEISSPPAQGKTAPLARGIVLRTASTPVVGEGMGFGVPIVHYPDGWVYSRTAVDADLSTPAGAIWQRTFQMDEIGGDAAHGYRFASIPSRGTIQVTYAVDGTGISVAVKVLSLEAGYSEVGILNEQSAAFNDFAAENQATLQDGAFGSWVPVTGRWARLRSGSLGIEWSVSAMPGATLHGGRELVPPDFNWAGLDYIFPSSFNGTTYRISVQEAR